jgi:hypothetical protein
MNVIVPAGVTEATLRPYSLSYTVAVSQTATDELTVSEYENTLGAVTCTRNEAGIYSFESDGLFIENKTIMPPFAGGEGNDVIIPIAGAGLTTYGYQLLWVNINIIKLAIFDGSFNNVDMSTVTNKKLLIQIVVYP